MKRTIKKLNNGDFEVQPDNTIVYGIRKPKKEEQTIRNMLRPKHRNLHRNLFEWPPKKPKKVSDLWDKPIKRNRKEQLTPEEIEYRHDQNKMKHDIDILDDIILSAHRRIAMYETLQQGTWYNIFRPDNTDEIVKERELIREFKKMKKEMIEWNNKRKTQS